MSEKIRGNLFERLLRDDETCVSIILTGVVCKFLPYAEFTGVEAFFVLLFIYMAVFSATHYVMDIIEKRKADRYITVPRSEVEDVS